MKCWKAGRPLLALAVLLVASAAAGAKLDAQEPIPPDTLAAPTDTAEFVVPPEVLPADTIPVAGADSVAGEVPDSLIPAPTFPRFPAAPEEGFAVARWEWDREELLLFHGLSLLDLLGQVPGITITRGGVFGRDVGVSAFGLGGGRVRVFLDGFELDPLTSTTLDLQRLALADLERLVVRRGLVDIRIDVDTYRLPDIRPFSVVEAGTGNDRTRLLRALFSRPLSSKNVLTLGFDVVDTEGRPFRAPFSATTGVARFTHSLSPGSAVQLEYRQTGVNREGRILAAEVPLLEEESSLRTLVLRARTNPRPAFTVDGMLGRAWRVPEDADSLGIDAIINQAAVRAAYSGSRAWLEATARGRFGSRDNFPAPDAELALRTSITPFPLLALDGEARYSDTGGFGGTEFSGTARLRLVGGLSLFGTIAGGSRGVALVRDTLVEDIVVDPETEVEDTVLVRAFDFPQSESRVAGTRAGAEWAWGSARLGAAYVSADADEVVPFGTQFDLGVEPLDPPVADGWEAYASVPLGVPQLRLEGFYWRSTEGLLQPYLPEEQGRLALEFHLLAYEGNQETTLRLEALRRGSALVPSLDTGFFDTASEAYNLFNLYLQIRVLDLRAFLVWTNLANLNPADIPGMPFPRQRALYGVRWHFRN